MTGLKKFCSENSCFRSPAQVMKTNFQATSASALNNSSRDGSIRNSESAVSIFFPHLASTFNKASSIFDVEDDKEQEEESSAVIRKFDKNIFLEELDKCCCLWDIRFSSYKERGTKINA